jgi:hypothetical protein
MKYLLENKIGILNELITRVCDNCDEIYKKAESIYLDNDTNKRIIFEKENFLKKILTELGVKKTILDNYSAMNRFFENMINQGIYEKKNLIVFIINGEIKLRHIIANSNSLTKYIEMTVTDGNIRIIRNNVNENVDGNQGVDATYSEIDIATTTDDLKNVSFKQKYSKITGFKISEAYNLKRAPNNNSDSIYTHIIYEKYGIELEKTYSHLHFEERSLRVKEGLCLETIDNCNYLEDILKGNHTKNIVNYSTQKLKRIGLEKMSYEKIDFDINENSHPTIMKDERFIPNIHGISRLNGSYKTDRYFENQQNYLFEPTQEYSQEQINLIIEKETDPILKKALFLISKE